MERFSHFYATEIKESETLAITKKVRELKAQGQDVVGLTLGEPDFDTPIHIKTAAIAAINDNFTHYTPVAGIPELRQAIVEKFARENGVSYQPAHILVSTGAKQSIFNVCQAATNPGDEVLVPVPCWVSYLDILKIAKTKVKTVECLLENNYKVTPQQLADNLTPNTRLLVLCTPSNPTGSMYSESELKALVEVLKNYPNLYIISDEIYEHIAFNGKHVSLASFPEIYERVILINGLSKGFAMTGWRLGYMASPSIELVKLCEKVQGQCTSGANSVAQKAAVAALNGDMQPTEMMRQSFEKRRNWMYEELCKIRGLNVNLPDGAFYFYPDIAHFLGKTTPNGQQIQTTEDLCFYLIECGVAVIPGTAFGTSHHIRISYAYALDILEAGAARLKTGLEALR